MLKIIQIALMISFFLSNSIAYAGSCSAKPTDTDAIASKIANGHSWGKHKDEFVAKTKVGSNIVMPDSPKVTSSGEFKSHIANVMKSSKKTLQRNRAAYWDSKTGTIVIYDPNSDDCGTAFRPTNGKSYYDSTQ